MAKTVISVDGLGKCYRIGARRERSRSLRESLASAATGVWRGAKALLAGAAPGVGTEEFWALKNISFEVQQGEVVGIIGRNGAGKSTLLKTLSRITEPTEGRAVLRGRVGSLLEVGTGFHPELTGRENIYLSGAILGMRKSEIDRKFDEIVAFADIEKFLDTPCKRYSSGMYVRLGFAVAAHLEPEILIVDEVLAVGDAAFQKRCLGKMGEAAQSGRTVLFVSHNMAAVQSMCNRSLLLEGGKIVADGSTADVMSMYLSGGDSGGSTVVNLAEAPRSGGYERAIQEAWLENDRGLVVAEAMTGEPLRICFRFKSCGQTTEACAFGFGIDNCIPLRILSLNNYISGDRIPAGLGEGVASLYIPEFPLLPGRYTVSVSLARDQMTLWDYVEQALSLSVIPGDVFGSGKTQSLSQGVVYARGHIHVAPVTANS